MRAPASVPLGWLVAVRQAHLVNILDFTHTWRYSVLLRSRCRKMLLTPEKQDTVLEKNQKTKKQPYEIVHIGRFHFKWNITHI